MYRQSLIAILCVLLLAVASLWGLPRMTLALTARWGRAVSATCTPQLQSVAPTPYFFYPGASAEP